jgi:putative hemolysin
MVEAPVILGLLVCAGLSFLLSGMETGVLVLSRLRIRQLCRAGNRRAELLQSYLEKPENFLWTILVGNTLANVTLLAITALSLYQMLGHRPILAVLAFFLAVFAFYTVCELLPKMLFRLYPNRLCLFSVVPFRFVYIGLSPLLGAIRWISQWLVRFGRGEFAVNIFGNREELRFLIQESGQDFTSEERAMILRVLDLQNVRLRQIVVPMDQVVGVIDSSSMQDLLKTSREKLFTRYPVWRMEGNRRRVVGIVSLKRLLYATDLKMEKPVSEYLKPALFLDEHMRLEDALRRLQRSGQRLAIVLSKDRRDIGIVSLQDILRSIFGEVNL